MQDNVCARVRFDRLRNLVSSTLRLVVMFVQVRSLRSVYGAGLASLRFGSILVKHTVIELELERCTLMTGRAPATTLGSLGGWALGCGTRQTESVWGIGHRQSCHGMLCTHMWTSLQSAIAIDDVMESLRTVAPLHSTCVIVNKCK
jgi:hypothetical protein